MDQSQSPQAMWGALTTLLKDMIGWPSPCAPSTTTSGSTTERFTETKASGSQPSPSVMDTFGTFYVIVDERTIDDWRKWTPFDLYSR